MQSFYIQVPTWYTIIESFLKICGKENFRRSKLNKLLLEIEKVLKKRISNKEVIKEIYQKLLIKANQEKVFVKIPKWDAFARKCKKALLSFWENDEDFEIVCGDTLDGTIHTHNGFTIKIIYDDEKHKKPHLHITKNGVCSKAVFSIKNLTKKIVGNIEKGKEKQVFEVLQEYKKDIVREYKKAYAEQIEKRKQEKENKNKTLKKKRK